MRTAPAKAWLAVCVPLAGAAFLVGAAFGGFDALTWMHLFEHDLPVVVLGWLILLAAPKVAARLPNSLPSWETTGRAPLAAAIILAAVVSYAGVQLVFERHPLSGDELMAVFDTAIFRSGALAAEVPSEWRPFAPALQPIFRVSPVDNAWWVSAYLPVNAMLRSVFARLGDAALAGPFWAALSVGLVYAVGRRLRPERPALALTAAVLLATSSQLLITAMTPYAMSAHLALNLLWLWLVLRGRLLGHAGAIGVAFAATGLHQLIFHPMFAAPFVLRLWLTRRWVAAAAHSLAYAGIGLFWATYWGWALPGPPADPGASAGGLVERALAFIVAFEPLDVAYTAANWLRLTVWQNPATVPLLAVSLLATWRRDSATLALWTGLIGGAVAVALLLPYQGHGWGFRYLHGLLGGACLLAAQGWLRLVDAAAESERRPAWTALGVVSAASLLILLPLRAWQANRYVHPSASASQAISRADADVVLVDGTGVWFASDLVRNDPFLRNRPKVLLLEALDADQVLTLCAQGRVSVFDRAAAERFGMKTTEAPPSAKEVELRAALRRASCAGAPFPARESAP